MRNFILAMIAGLLVTSLLPTRGFAQKGAKADRWEKDIAAYEAQDKESPPPKGGIVFIGSSTIRRWATLAQDFPDHKVINRGFGGSQIADSARYAERIVIPYAPKAVFLRAGGNDIKAGKSADQVFTDFQNFVSKVHAKLPLTEIYFIGLCPSVSRWDQAEAEKSLNEKVKGFAAGKANVKYIDCWNMTLGADGKPRPELFVKDMLHFNEEGNRLLAERVRPHLPK